MLKRVIRTSLWAAGLAMVTAFAAPVANVAPDIVRSVTGKLSDCGYCQDAGGTHAFQGSGAIFSCSACNSCHSNWQGGWCANNHCACVIEENESKLATPTFEMVASVASLKDPRAVAAFVARHSSRVRYNANRGVMQVLSCDARIIAQFPVDGPAVALLE